MKHVPSQQGRTPAAATPPVSTPFSQVHAAFSPRGPRSSPQNMKKSPANSATLMGHSISNSGMALGGGPGSVPAMNYDSPAAAAMGALGLVLGGLDNISVGGLSQLGSLGRADEDERARRLQKVLEMLKVCLLSALPVFATDILSNTPRKAKAGSARPDSSGWPSLWDWNAFGRRPWAEVRRGR